MQCFRWHPALKLGILGPMVGRVPLHIQQSAIDGACGHHCTLMALMALGVLKRADLGSLPRARSKSLSHMWRMTATNYFVGTTASDLQYMLAHYETIIETRIRRKNQIAQVLDVLMNSGVAIVGIRNASMDHWVLAAGVGGVEAAGDIDPRSLLILDPGHGALSLAAWNAVLSVKPDRQDRHIYETTQRRMKVHIDNIVTIRRRDSDGR
jgi:hypothetical protein